MLYWFCLAEVALCFGNFSKKEAQAALPQKSQRNVAPRSVGLGRRCSFCPVTSKADGALSHNGKRGGTLEVGLQ